MVSLEQLAEAVLQRNSLLARSLTQDFLRETESLSEVPPPNGNDERLLATAAAIVELFAARRNQAPPRWTQDIGPLAEPFFLVEAAERMKHLRTLCETQSPEPMLKRRLYAPPNFLVFA
jgi:hypothetical protein